MQPPSGLGPAGQVRVHAALEYIARCARDGYDGNVMFENLELVRTVKATGGRESVPLDVYVRRLPPTTEHFWSQRVRQAYDEFARPRRLAIWLGVVPSVAVAAFVGGWITVGSIAVGTMLAAEAGRRRAGGRRVFPALASLCAPLWMLERGICAWLAVGAHLLLGGIPYRGRIVSRAATPMRQLTLPAKITAAIEDKLSADQESQRMTFVLTKEKQEAERKRIEAQGVADFQKIVTDGISDKLLQWKGIEATQDLAKSQNAKIVIIGNAKNGLPLVLGDVK